MPTSAEWHRCHIPVFVGDPKQWWQNRRLTLQSEVLIHDNYNCFATHLHRRGQLESPANNEQMWVNGRDQIPRKVTGALVEQDLMANREYADLKSKTGLPVLVAFCAM